MIRYTGKTSFILLLFILILNAGTGVFADSVSYDTFNVIYFDKVPYISMVDLAETYRVKISYDPFLLSMTAQRGDLKLTLSNHSRTAVLNGSSKNIFLPARLMRGTIFAPVPTFLPIFSELIPGTLTWDEKKRAVMVSGIITTINKVAYEYFSNGTLICISLSEPLKHRVELKQNNWLTVNFTDGSFEPDTLFPGSSSDLIRDTRCFQHENEAQLAFLISDNVQDFSVAPSANPNEVLISLRKKIDNIPFTHSIPAYDNYPAMPELDAQIWRIDTVVIDPGHGGKDPGAIGPKKTKEKDVVLNVAKELKKIIDSHGEIKAVLTRDRDVFLPLHERARIAHKSGGKLFISLHVNSSRSRYAKGMEVFFLSVAKTKDAEEVARRENKSIEMEEDIEFYSQYASFFNGSSLSNDIMSEMASKVFLDESQDICSILLDKACSATRFQRRGVKQAGFYVMLGTQAFMPSVLFEIGFISNPEEEKKMRRVSYQKRLAKAIYDSIITFKKKHEGDLFSRSD